MTHSIPASPEAQAATADVLTAFGADSAFAGLPEVASKVHKAVVRLYAETGHPPTTVALSDATGLSPASVESTVAELAGRDLVVLEDGQIVGAYPFTERDTGITVRCGGDAVHAMCAVDALGAGAMLDRDSEIEAHCVHCSARISVRSTARGTQLESARPEAAVVWVGIRKDDGPAASSLCTVIRFACCAEHLAAWRETQAPMTGHLLSVGDGLAVGRGIFGDLLRGNVGVNDD